MRIECAFGMLVGRWGILRRALPSCIDLRKITALVMCLCRLHNFLVDVRVRARDIAAVRLADSEDATTTSKDQKDVPPSLAGDALEIATNGGVPLVQRGGNDQRVPADLLDGGHHFQDTTEAFRRAFMRRGLGDAQLPRERLTEAVRFGGFERTLPANWR
mgnify:CR=1 FL=1